jgi:cellulose synthase/poly-beta-1,6-N-acetylglucosamine synthase-like glycosyltransferase
MVATIVFIGAVVLIAYTYAGYPAVIFLLGRAIGRPVRKRDDITPKVSIIIAAFNEERDIAAKLENTLSLDYPKNQLEIMVASDCCTDSTDDIVNSYAQHGIQLVRQPKRLGKTSAQNQAARISTGEIILFSDATTRYELDTVRKVVRGFADPAVGCVTGRVVYVDPGATAVGRGMRSYWGYESFLRQCESLCGGLIGVCGCLYAVRRRNYRPLANDMCSDFVIASDIHLQGLKAVYEPEAVATELTNGRGRDEFRMRVRIAEQTVSSLSRYRQILNPFRHGVFAFQMLCHKVLRYTVPAWLVVLFVSNLLVLNAGPVYRMALAAHSAFYLLALGGWVLERLGIKQGLLGVPYYFVLSNAAVVWGFIKFARGESHVVWQPIRDEA